MELSPFNILSSVKHSKPTLFLCSEKAFLMESRVASVGVRRVKSALARSKSSDKFVIGFKQPLFVN